MLNKLLTSCAICFSTSLIAQQLPITVEAPVKKVFIPSGFDDNDQVEVMLDIEFPNTCFRFGTVVASEPDRENKIKVKADALRYQDAEAVCTQIIVPFLATAKIGLLKEGIYKVIVNEGPNEISKTLVIGKRTIDLPDEHLYAPVEFADIVKDPLTEKDVLFIQGRYPLYLKGCSKIVEVRQLRDADDLLTVLPIMEMFHDADCGNEPLSFKLSLPLEDPLVRKGLLHVRKFEGDAFNKLIK